MIYGGDLDMLEKCIPKYDQIFNERYAFINKADGGWDLFNERGWSIDSGPYQTHYGNLRNGLLRMPVDRESTKKFLLMLDADEVMFPSDLIALDSLVETVSEPVIRLPRYNLAGPRFDWFDQGYPDWQARVIRLGAGVTFSGQVHEQAVVGHSFAPGHKAAQHIYHYGYCRDPRLIWLRHQNYKRLELAMPPLLESEAIYPDDIESYISRHATVPFNQPHPLAA